MNNTIFYSTFNMNPYFNSAKILQEYITIVNNILNIDIKDFIIINDQHCGICLTNEIDTIENFILTPCCNNKIHIKCLLNHFNLIENKKCPYCRDLQFNNLDNTLINGILNFIMIGIYNYHLKVKSGFFQRYNEITDKKNKINYYSCLFIFTKKYKKIYNHCDNDIKELFIDIKKYKEKMGTLFLLMKEEINKSSINNNYLILLRDNYIYKQQYYKDFYDNNGNIIKLLNNIKTLYDYEID